MPIRHFQRLLFLLLCGFALYAQQNKPATPLSEQTQSCIQCHNIVTPGIVQDWLHSRHSQITPKEALTKATLAKRMSAAEVPGDIAEVAVGCYECHSRNTSTHKDSFTHYDFSLHVVVSPNDCKTCHPDEAEEYANGKKAHALDNLRRNPVYHSMVETFTGMTIREDGRLLTLPASEFSKNETCYGCHGTEIVVQGMREVVTETDTIQVPNLLNWPNHGVGRINPDGSRGACTSCHPRHSFAIEIARKPHTCAQCHLEPDTPAWNVYSASKHGNIFLSQGQAWDWQNVPWKVGTDFRAPACSSCHNSLLVSPEDDVIAPRSHDFGARLWVRLFGLIYAHPQPKDGRTYLISNQDSMPLPVSLGGVMASDWLLNEKEQATRQAKMQKVCQACHSTSYIQNFFAKLHNTIGETNKMTIAATQLISHAWDKGFADRRNLFDETLEHKWVKQWLFYANTVRYASAMSDPDHAAFKYGWFDLTTNLRDMEKLIRLCEKKD